MESSINMTWQKGILGVFNIYMGFNNLTPDERTFIVHNQAFLPVAKGRIVTWRQTAQKPHHAAVVSCPTCGVKWGRDCVSVDGEGTTLKRRHSDRIKLARIHRKAIRR